MRSTLPAWGVILYAWAWIAWCCGVGRAVAAVVAPMVLVFLWGLIRGFRRQWQVERATRRAFKR